MKLSLTIILTAVVLTVMFIISPPAPTKAFEQVSSYQQVYGNQGIGGQQ